MVPKIIHCCWFGGPKTALARRCRASWARFAPDWEIREFVLPEELLPFVRAAVRAEKWAVVSDWARMQALYDSGGVYFDYDVELVRPFAPPSGEWVAEEWISSGATWMNPGSGLALEKGSAVARYMLDVYARTDFDEKRDMMPWINRRLSEAGPLRRLKPEVFSPIDLEGRLHITDETLGIHRYAMSGSSRLRRLARWVSWHGGRPLVEMLLGLRRRFS